MLTNDRKHQVAQRRRFARIGGVALVMSFSLLNQSGVAADSTNAPPRAPRTRPVHIYNPAAPAENPVTAMRPIAMYASPLAPEHLDRVSLKAREQRFRIGFSGSADDTGEVSIPHAIHGPRRRLFGEEDPNNDTLFGDVSERSPWESESEDGWGWLARDISRSRRESDALIELNNEATYRRNALLGGSGLQDPTMSHRLGRDILSSDFSAPQSTRAADPFAPFNAYDPSRRQRPNSSR